MKIYILAGSKSELFSREISKRSDSIDIMYNNNISAGLSDIELYSDIDKIVLFDSAYEFNGRMLDLSEVFTAVGKFANANCEVLVITINSVIQNKFIESLYSTENCRCELIEKVTGSELLDLIMNKTRPVKVDAVNIADQIESEIEPREVITPQPIPEPEPEPEPEPVKPPEPVKASEPEPKKIKTQKSLLKNIKGKKKLKDYFTAPKVLLVTGNPNSGVTSTACELFDTACSEGVKTLLIDLDVHTLGTTLYMSNLDNVVSNRLEKTGLLSALENPGKLDTFTHTVKEYGDVLGCNSDVYCEDVLLDRDLQEKISDVISIAVTEYTLVIVHMPISVMKKTLRCVKDYDSILYCAKSNINALYTIRSIFRISEDQGDDYIRKISLVYRKLKYLLCDVGENNDCITPNNFLGCLVDLSGTDDYAKTLVGSIEHIKGFDNFKGEKYIHSNRNRELYIDILVKSIFG